VPESRRYEEELPAPGDSHAADLWYGLDATFPAINFLQATAADCYPTVAHSLGERSYCTRLMDGIFQKFLIAHSVDEVVISARWTAARCRGLSATLLWLKDRHIAATVLGPVAIYDGPLPRLMIIGARKGKPNAADSHWIIRSGSWMHNWHRWRGMRARITSPCWICCAGKAPASRPTIRASDLSGRRTFHRRRIPHRGATLEGSRPVTAGLVA